MTTLVVTNAQIATAMRIADSTFRCFRLASAPRDLPYDPVPADHENGRPQRGYHVTAILEWLRRASPHRVTSAFESQLMAAAASNLVRLESA
jgi:hypothetical protein